MSRICEKCQKKYTKGNQITKAWGVKYRSIKMFMPNLRNVTVKIDGKKKRLKICAKCLKKIKGKSSATSNAATPPTS